MKASEVLARYGPNTDLIPSEDVMNALATCVLVLEDVTVDEVRKVFAGYGLGWADGRIVRAAFQVQTNHIDRAIPLRMAEKLEALGH